MSFYGWKPYVSVAERRRKAEKEAAKAKKAGADLAPIESYRGAIAKTFWGKAWCENLEAYSDYANRLPRGRTYVRNGSVIDLKIAAGEVRARVMGSSLYEVAVKVTTVPAKHWQAIGADCSGSIDSLVELLQGKLSKAVMERICTPRTGLFPAPKDIEFSCSCPDWASMCKHVAAVLYGVGARLDKQPELLFNLRRVDAKDLVRQASAGLPKSKKGPAAGKLLDTSMLGDVFGIEMDEAPAPAAPRKKPVVVKEAAKKALKPGTNAKVKSSRKPLVIPKAASVKKASAVKPAILKSAGKSMTVSGKLPAGKSGAAVTRTTRTKTAKAARGSSKTK